MDYDTLRHIADSWGLLFLIVLFVGAVAFVYRPGARKKYQEYGKIPLRNEED